MVARRGYNHCTRGFMALLRPWTTDVNVQGRHRPTIAVVQGLHACVYYACHNSPRASMFYIAHVTYKSVFFLLVFPSYTYFVCDERSHARVSCTGHAGRNEYQPGPEGGQWRRGTVFILVFVYISVDLAAVP